MGWRMSSWYLEFHVALRKCPSSISTFGFFEDENREDLRKRHSGERRTHRKWRWARKSGVKVSPPQCLVILILWSLLLGVLIPETPFPPLFIHFFPSLCEDNWWPVLTFLDLIWILLRTPCFSADMCVQAVAMSLISSSLRRGMWTEKMNKRFFLS